MRINFWTAVIVAALFLPVSPALLVAQSLCRGRPCCGSSVQLVQTYQWRQSNTQPHVQLLYWGADLVGGYNTQTTFFMPFSAGQWGKVCAAPVPPPGYPGGSGEPTHLFGVMRPELTGGEKMMCGDKVCSRHDIEMLLADGLADDCREPHLTIVAKNASTAAKIKTEWEAAKPQISGLPAHKFQAYDGSNPISKAVLEPLELDKNGNYQDKGLLILAQASHDDPKLKGKWAAHYEYNGPKDVSDPLRIVDPWAPPPNPGDRQVRWLLIELVFFGIVIIIVVVVAASRRSDKE